MLLHHYPVYHVKAVSIRKNTFPLRALVIIAVFLMLTACFCMSGHALAKECKAGAKDNIIFASVLDLTNEGITDAAYIKSRIADLPKNTKVILGGTPLKIEDRKDLMQSFPEIDFEWSFTMYDIPVSSTDEKIDLGKKKITKIEELMDYLDCLPHLMQVDMYISRLKEKQILALSERYPGIRFGWTLVVCRFEVRTDAKVFSMHRRGTPLYKSEDFRLLRFCTDMMALDLGHNEITDLTFLTNFPKLKILILADNKITDILPLAKLTDLEYLELFMNKITDVSPLKGLAKLLDLNLCFNNISDASPLLSLDRLERLWISRNGIEQDQKDKLLQGLPKCNINFTAKLSTWDGWRSHERFSIMRDVLNTGNYRDWK